jgi:hypothetical protein
MKGAAVYGFDRFASVKELREALQPEDMDFESLHNEEVSAQQFVKKPFWYRRREKTERRYMLAAAVILLVGIIVLVPRLYGVVNDIRINHFYNRFNSAELAEQCEMLTDLSEAQRKRYTNDYIDLDENLTDEEKAESFVTKYYDFQLKKYVTYEQFDTARDCYEYMQIDLRKGEAWINYQNQDEIMHRTIQLTPLADGSYEVTTEFVKNDGTRTKETEYVKYVKLTE